MHRRRVTWMHLRDNCQVVAVDGGTLTLGFSNAGARDSFDAGGSPDIVREACIEVIGHDWQVETIIDPGADASTPPPAAAAPAADPAPNPRPSRPAADPGPDLRSAREAIRPTRDGGEPPPVAPDLAEADASASPDDLDADTDDVAGADLLARELGAEVIEEIPHQ